MKSLFYSLLCICILGFITSCGDDDGPSGNCTDGSFGAAFQTELNNINTATSNYINDPSTANCNAYKNAYQEYLDAIETYEDCARQVGELEEWRQALDDTRMAIDDLVC